ncbi:MAG: CsgG/HfaB family protein [Acidobacteriota bacterium]
MKRVGWRTVLTWVVGAALIAAEAPGQERTSIARPGARPSSTAPVAPTVAVVEFDFTAIRQWWALELGLGAGIADLITDGLVNDGRYRVIERRFLKAILAEQALAADPRLSSPTEAQLARAGKLLGAEYLVVGSVTRFGTEHETRGGAGAIIGRAVGGGLFKRETGKAAVSLTARLVDASTGVVSASVQGEGISSRKGTLLGGGAGGGTGGGFGGVSMRSSAFRETILGEATEAAVRRVVERLVASQPRPTRLP